MRNTKTVVVVGFHHGDKILVCLRKGFACFGSRFQGFQPMSFGLKAKLLPSCWAGSREA